MMKLLLVLAFFIGASSAIKCYSYTVLYVLDEETCACGSECYTGLLGTAGGVRNMGGCSCTTDEDAEIIDICREQSDMTGLTTKATCCSEDLCNKPTLYETEKETSEPKGFHKSRHDYFDFPDEKEQDAATMTTTPEEATTKTTTTAATMTTGPSQATKVAPTTQTKPPMPPEGNSTMTKAANAVLINAALAVFPLLFAALL